jgi:hypothetical protein
MNHKLITAAGLALAALLVQPSLAEAALEGQVRRQDCGQGQETSTQDRGELRGKRSLGRRTQRTGAEKRIVRDERADSEQDPERRKKAKKKTDGKKKKKGERKKKGKKKKRIGRRGTPPVGGRPPQGTPPQGGGPQ